MASILTPLQVTVAAALLNNQGLQPLPAALTAALTAFKELLQILFILPLPPVL
jgi:hypothetical protein